MQELIEKYLKGDKTIWTVVILLTLASTVIALSASSNMAYRLTEGNATPFWFKHVATLVLGFVMMIYLQHFKFKYFSRISQLGIWVAGILLLMTLLFGKNINSAQSDFIFATIVEEFGSLIGALILLLLYLTFFFRSIRIVLKADSSFGSYVAFGLSFLLVLQAMINMGVGVNLLPVTGQPLPLISMGGTSILFTCISIGILLNISKSVEVNEKQVA